MFNSFVLRFLMFSQVTRPIRTIIALITNIFNPFMLSFLVLRQVTDPIGTIIALMTNIFHFFMLAFLVLGQLNWRLSTKFTIITNKLNHLMCKTISGSYLTPSNVYIGFPYNPLVRPKRHRTMCAISPKSEARTHGPGAPSVPKVKLGHMDRVRHQYQSRS